MSKSAPFLPSNLIDRLDGYRILSWKLFSFRILKVLLHCLPASTVAVEKSKAILIFVPLHETHFLPLEVYRILSLFIAF